MDDELQRVDVATARHRLEEIAADDRAAIGHAGGLEEWPRPSHDMRCIEEHPAHARPRLQDGREQCSMPTRDVDNRARGGKVVSSDELLGARSRTTRHARVEDRSRRCILFVVLPVAHARSELIARLARAHRANHVTPGEGAELTPQQRRPAHGPRHVAQQLCIGRQTRGLLGKHPDTSQESQ